MKNISTLLKNIEILKPVYSDNYITITFAASNYFAPYLGATIQSIIEKSNSAYCYDLIVFTRDISDINKNILRSMVNSENFSIRFINLSNIFKDLKLYTPGHITIETYFRLIIPLFMKNYSKFVFLDSDIIVQDDIRNLYKFDISNYALAATEECLMSALVGIHGQDMIKYMTNILHLRNIDKYFQAGVMFINTNYFIRNNICEKLMQMVINYDYRIVDQDAMNALLNDKILWLPNEWNYPPLQEHMKKNNYLENMSDYIREKYLSVKNPKIVHFADNEKPWFNPKEDYAHIWWEYARKTPFYEQILYNMTTNIMQITFNNLKNMRINSINYWKCKLFKNITFGKTRKHYIKKEERLKEKIDVLKRV